MKRRKRSRERVQVKIYEEVACLPLIGLADSDPEPMRGFDFKRGGFTSYRLKSRAHRRSRLTGAMGTRMHVDILVVGDNSQVKQVTTDKCAMAKTRRLMMGGEGGEHRVAQRKGTAHSEPQEKPSRATTPKPTQHTTNDTR